MNPWDKYQTPGPWTKYTPAAAEVAPESAAAPTMGEQFKRQAGLAVRNVADAAAALPLMALDAGVAMGNDMNRGFFDTPERELLRRPSELWREGMDSLLPRPESTAEKVTKFGTDFLVGSKIPTGMAAAPPVSQATSIVGRNAENAQSAGYVIPPTTSNPNAITKTLEGVAGKLTTAQLASARNESNTLRLAAKAIGLDQNAPLTLDAIRGVRAEAGKAADVVRKVGRIATDAEYQKTLNTIRAKFLGAGKDFPELASSKVDDVVSGLNKSEFDSDSAVDMISILRENADDAFRQGQSSLGRAYRAGSKALEDQIERHLEGQGAEAAEILAQYRAGRQLMAKTYTVEKAFTETTGKVNAGKIARELGRGKPLTGELRQIGEFGTAFPKAAREFNESLPGVSPLDFYSAGGLAAMLQNPLALAMPFIRQGTRHALLSPTGQRLAVPSQPQAFRQEPYMGALNALVAASQD